MAKKPIYYEELRQRMKELEHDTCEPKWAEERVKQQGEFLNLVLDSLPHPFYVIDAFDYTIKVANSATHTGPLSSDTTCYALTHKSDRPCALEGHPCPLEIVKKTRESVTVEHLHYDKDGNLRNVEVHAHPIFDSDGNVTQVIEYCVDITERRRAEEALLAREAELEEQSRYLEEVNSALKVLLEQREQDKKEVEKDIVSNVKALLSPYVEELKETRLDTRQKTLVSVLESNLDNIVSPLVRKLSSKFSSLSAMEIQVANLIKVGKTNKEMAEILGVSEHTISSHRYRLRTKLGLKNKNVNLRSHLLFLEV